MNSETPTKNPLSRFLRALPGWVINLWISFVLIAFFVIRILGSSTGRRILSALGIRYGE